MALRPQLTLTYARQHGVTESTGGIEMPDGELVKVELAARALGLNKHFLYKLAATGRVPCYRAGRALRFSIPELLEWMRSEAQSRQSAGMNHDR